MSPPRRPSNVPTGSLDSRHCPGADSCSEVGNDASVSLLMAAPAVMALGVVVAAILFGLNKRWPWWVGALAAGAALGMCGYVSWFALVSQWCG